MPPDKSSRTTLRIVAAAVVATLAANAAADAYRDARAELVAAFEADDFPAMRAAAARALDARPGFPSAIYNQAFAATLAGDYDVAMASLAELADLGIDFGVVGADAFAALHSHPGWPRYVASMERVSARVGEAAVAFEIDVPEFVPEGIAIDDDFGLVLGGIRTGEILRVDEEVVQRFRPAGHWSVFGMRRDAAGGLWFASSRVPQYRGPADRSAFNAGLYRLDLATNRITERARLPVFAAAQVLGDLVIVGDSIYTTDSVDGPLYRYSLAQRRFDTLVPKGVFVSPQGLVPAADGEALYVADYNGGLYRVRLDDGAVSKVENRTTASDYGIDGLYRHGRRLIAIQNGIRPHRVVAFEPDAAGDAVVAAEVLLMNHPDFDEPTLGTIVGDDLLLVANSHWNRFDADGELPGDLRGPVILRLALARD